MPQISRPAAHRSRRKSAEESADTDKKDIVHSARTVNAGGGRGRQRSSLGPDEAIKEVGIAHAGAHEGQRGPTSPPLASRFASLEIGATHRCGGTCELIQTTSPSHPARWSALQSSLVLVAPDDYISIAAPVDTRVRVLAIDGQPPPSQHDSTFWRQSAHDQAERIQNT